MPTCDKCGKEITFPYTCSYCGGSFCGKHRLPENHGCQGLDEISDESKEEGRIYRGVSEDLEPERSEESSEKPEEISFRMGPGPGRKRDMPEREPRPSGGTSSFFKNFILGNATFFLLFLMVVMFIGRRVAQSALGPNVFFFLVPTQATFLAKPWTVLTSIFTHGGFFHLFVNGLVLFFIGPALELRTGRNKFIGLFIGAGAVATVAQLLVVTHPYVPVLGASGAILGVLGTLTALAPRTPVLFLFFIPMPLWMLTLGFGAFSMISQFTGIFPGTGHMAHFVGLIIGLIYGYKLKKDREKKQRQSFGLFMGGRGS